MMDTKPIFLQEKLHMSVLLVPIIEKHKEMIKTYDCNSFLSKIGVLLQVFVVHFLAVDISLAT